MYVKVKKLCVQLLIIMDLQVSYAVDRFDEDLPMSASNEEVIAGTHSLISVRIIKC